MVVLIGMFATDALAETSNTRAGNNLPFQRAAAAQIDMYIPQDLVRTSTAACENHQKRGVALPGYKTGALWAGESQRLFQQNGLLAQSQTGKLTCWKSLVVRCQESALSVRQAGALDENGGSDLDGNVVAITQILDVFGEQSLEFALLQETPQDLLDVLEVVVAWLTAT